MPFDLCNLVRLNLLRFEFHRAVYLFYTRSFYKDLVSCPKTQQSSTECEWHTGRQLISVRFAVASFIRNVDACILFLIIYFESSVN